MQLDEIKKYKLHSSVHSTEHDTELQRKKTIFCENSYVDVCSYKRFLQNSSERVPINGIILRVQAVQINKLLDGDKTFKASEGWL
jgi:hypothetical protein